MFRHRFRTVSQPQRPVPPQPNHVSRERKFQRAYDADGMARQFYREGLEANMRFAYTNTPDSDRRPLHDDARLEYDSSGLAAQARSSMALRTPLP